ncbi:MAG TPA: class III extradiol ring-cleavage dioxygenase [Xanthomonadales bacterium]|nr:class III extradiol ring-cleavage dioxygenase [Xanthomonadales bacterium]
MKQPPALFLSHGSPMFALEPGEVGPRLGRLGATLSEVRSVLVVSPHWQTREVVLSTTATPATLHDFGGFPAPLYQLRYPAPGAPATAQAAIELLRKAGIEVSDDASRGLDHGAWVPLLHLFPSAHLPVCQMSLPATLDAAGALRLGAALAPLRGAGVLLIGSGSLTHNLHEFGRPIADPEYARAFADWVRDAVEQGDVAALVDYRNRAPHARRAHPTEEHFLPLLVALGASLPADRPQWIAGEMTHQVLSMAGCAWGLDSAGIAAVSY